MEKKKIKYPPLRRDWYKCPACGTKLAIVENNAKCSGVYMKCRTCKNEIEIKK